jgi:hypothetical protein
MKQLIPRPPEARPDTLADLAEEYAERHKAMEEYIFAWFTTFNLMRWSGIDPLSWLGRLISILFVIILFLVVPLSVTAITGQWSIAPVRTWAVVAVVFGLLGVAIYEPFQRAIDTFLSLHRAMADEAGLRRLIAWDRRWNNIRTTVPAAGTFAAGLLVLLFLSMQKPGVDIAMPAGTVVLGAMLLYQVCEITYTVFILGLESRILVAYDYELYRLSPIDSVALQQSIRGSNQIGVLVSLVATVFIIGFVILLPDPQLMILIGLILLGMAYLTTGFGVILPRLAMKRIVQLEKEREMVPLQRRLDYLSARLRELTEEEYEEMKRLKETHDIIRDSSEDVLPISTIGQLVSSLIVPTVALVAAVAGETFLGTLFERLMP